MQADKTNPVAHSLFTDLMRDIKRLHSHFTAIAYPVLNREGEMRTSRWRGYSEPKPETARDAVEGNAEDITAEAGNAVEGHVVEGNVEVKPS
jgi:predicted NAD/FAD-dependent oxidoreductase